MSDHIKATILILDPDSDFLETAARLNPHSSLRVITQLFGARDKGQLAPLAQEHYPDIVVVNLDVDNELDFGSPIQQIQEIPMALPPLIMGTSARDAFALRQKAYRMGIDDFMLRPFHPQEMWHRIGVLLRIRRLQRQIDAASRNLALLNSKLASSNRKLEHMTLTDELTGLSNMRYMYKFLEDHFPILKRHPRPFALLMMDLDHFKRVNDTNDHLVGSNTIREVGLIIDQVMRKSDIKARYGGDEYIIAMPETDEAGALLAAERLREAVSKAEMKGSDGAPFHITTSIGLASYDFARHEDFRGLIKDADRAMYAAKHKGRNRAEYYRHGQTDVLAESTGFRDER